MQKKLTDIADERLRIILEMDFSWSRISGCNGRFAIERSRNILGEVQTGHMSRGRMELYLEMLEEAVARLKGQPQNNMVETELTLGIPAHIPDTYIEKQSGTTSFLQDFNFCGRYDCTGNKQSCL